MGLTKSARLISNFFRLEKRTRPERPERKHRKKKRHAAQKGREKMLLKAMPGGDVGAHSDLFVPSQWLSETIPRKTPYFPQIGDVLMYFKSGHQKYIELVELRNSYKVNIGLYDTFGDFRGDFLMILGILKLIYN